MRLMTSLVAGCMVVGFGGYADAQGACAIAIGGGCLLAIPTVQVVPPVPVVVAAPPVVVAPPAVVAVPDEYGATWVDGAPFVVEDGVQLAVVYDPVHGWGYWDGHHGWHGADRRFAERMEHDHPRGFGFHPGMNAPFDPHRVGPHGVPGPAGHPMMAAAGHPGPAAHAPQPARRACGGAHEPHC